jgi:hypothetical protein
MNEEPNRTPVAVVITPLSIADRLRQNTVLFSFSAFRFSNSRMVPTSKIEVVDELQMSAGRMVPEKVDKNRLRAGKRLIRDPAYDDIVSLDAQFRKWLTAIALPQPLYRPGLRVVPRSRLGTIKTQLDEYEASRQLLISTLAARFTQILATSQQDLGVLFHRDDYPASPDAFEQAFFVTAEFLSLDPPDLPPDLAAAGARRNEQTLLNYATENMWALRRSFDTQATTLLEQLLATRKEGAPRMVLQATLNNLRQYLEYLGDRDISDDDKLKTLAQMVISSLGDASPDDLQDLKFRDVVTKTFLKVTRDMADLMASAPDRVLTLDDDD